MCEYTALNTHRYHLVCVLVDLIATQPAMVQVFTKQFEGPYTTQLSIIYLTKVTVHVEANTQPMKQLLCNLMIHGSWFKGKLDNGLILSRSKFL